MKTKLTAQEIIRCFKRDWGHTVYDLENAVRYCERIAIEAEYGAYTNKEDAELYREAARLMRQEAEYRKIQLVQYVTLSSYEQQEA